MIEFYSTEKDRITSISQPELANRRGGSTSYMQQCSQESQFPFKISCGPMLSLRHFKVFKNSRTNLGADHPLNVS